MSKSTKPRALSVKTVNQKIRRLAKKYGTNNVEYKKYLSDIDRNFQYHYTKEGYVQINAPKEMSKYQKQVLHKLGGRKGVGALEKAAKKRLYDEKGITKPSKSEIEAEVNKFSQRQSKIDDTLEAIYIEENEGTLPKDLADIYSRMHRRGKGAGSGVSNADLDNLINGIEEWQQVKEEIQDISLELQTNYYMSTSMEADIWDAMSGRNTLEENKELLRELREYLEELQADSEV